MSGPHSLADNWLHLGLGATAEVLEPFDGMEWYERYGTAQAADGAEGRLVSMYTFDADWDSWEVHPEGAEVVICTAGSIELVQELADGSHATATLGAGQYAVNPPGTWHTANVADTTTCIFITAGKDTRHRPRRDKA